MGGHRPDQPAAEALLELLREQIASTPLIYGEQQIFLSATLGLAAWPADGQSAEQLYRCADQRLYRGKALGRNRLVSRDDAAPALSEEAPRRA